MYFLLHGTVTSLVERNALIDALSKKQSELTAKIAMQDDEIVDLKWRKEANEGGGDNKTWSKAMGMIKSRFNKE
jgi:hypothetical protein